MLRRTRALTLIAALLAGACGPIRRTAPPSPGIRPLAIVARPVALDPAEPARRSIGSLTYLGGWVLTSAAKDFGSISAMSVERGRVTALSDAGMLFRFRLGAGGRVGEATIAPLPDVPDPGDAKDGRDSESLQIDPASGRAWVGFEQHLSIWRYAPGFDRAEAHSYPDAMRDWPPNGGPEAMVRLRDGRFLFIAERAQRPDGTAEALLFPGDPTEPGAAPIRFGYRGVTPYVATDAAELPDGRVLVLNRHFSTLDGVSALLTVLDPRDIAPGKAVAGREIARLAPPLTIDNMEALSIEREAGRTVLWIGSDDNFDPRQRTLLMKFALTEEPRSGRSRQIRRPRTPRPPTS